MAPDRKLDLLIVDDNPENARLIEKFSRISPTIPSTVRRASSVDEAIAAFQSSQPGLTILNLNLRSGNDGIKLLQMTDKSRKPFIQGPVIIASGDSDPELIKQCYAGPANVVAYLVKPYDITWQQISALSEKYLGSTTNPSNI